MGSFRQFFGGVDLRPDPFACLEDALASHMSTVAQFYPAMNGQELSLVACYWCAQAS